MITEPRKPGWYWVKLRPKDEWLISEFGREGLFLVRTQLLRDSELGVIGARIPTPDEAQ